MKNISYRHGDVLLQRVDAALTKKIRAAKAEKKTELTIALGEATGHHHTLYPVGEKSGVRLVEIEGRRFIDVPADYFLRHQEHKEHRIAPGCYEILMEDEYSPFDKIMKKVID